MDFRALYFSVAISSASLIMSLPMEEVKKKPMVDEIAMPTKGKYFEADVNYHCGNRNADRIVYNTEGEVWLTKNHYKSFQKQ